MTFVLNLIHPRFSILTADVRGEMPGGGDLSVGSVKIHVQGRLTINGIAKIRLSNDGLCAVGIAGDTHSHPYLEHIPQIDATQAIDAVRDGAYAWTTIEKLRERLKMTSYMEQSVIATLYDPESDRICSFVAVTAPAQFSSAWAAATSKSQLKHIGTGSAKFGEAVTLDAINAFVTTLSQDTDPDTLYPWFEDAFAKVSRAADGCSADFRAVIASREEPRFRDWKPAG